MTEPFDRTRAESAASQRLGDQHLKAGNLPAAIECYGRAIELDGSNGPALQSLGMAHFRAQNYDEAEHWLRQAVTAGAASAPLHYFLGVSLLRLDKLDDAIAQLMRARDLQPDADIVYGDLIQALFMARRYDDARETVQRAAASHPGMADLYVLLGKLFADSRQFESAVQCFQERLALDARHVHALYFLAEAREKASDFAGAAENYREVIALQPDFAEACNNLAGICFNQLGDPRQALTYYQQATALRPDIPEIHLNLALVQKACGDFNGAATSCGKALALKPAFAEAHASLGSLFLEQGRLDEAMASYDRALGVRPDYADACNGMANTLVAAHRDQEALPWFQRAVTLDPENFTARTMLLHLQQQICDWGEMELHLRAIRNAIATAPPVSRYKILPLPFFAFPGTSAAEQKYCAERYSRQEYGALAALRSQLAFDFSRRRGEKIHIGYLSGDFRQHAVSFLMAEVFERHDRSRFHVTAYSYGTDDGSAMRKRLEHAFDEFVDIRDLPYETAARRIYEDGTDILVDLSGHTMESRSGILALRPAPVQVNYLGYPGTMGADFIDYMIADRFTVPDDLRQHYTEQIVWLPDCFQANDTMRAHPPAPTRSECGLPEEEFVFCCFNQTFKITPEFFDIWCSLLRKTPGSVLWLPASMPQAEANLRREATKRGVAAERIVMAPLQQRDEHLARLQCADLFLDTLPFNAGTTCSDALWMGVPVVTCSGDAFASRMAGSLLTALDVPELVTHAVEDYHALAHRLASDRTYHAEIRARIAAGRKTTPLFDSRRFTASLEHAYDQMLNATLHGRVQ